jgi:hypothetical protein
VESLLPEWKSIGGKDIHPLNIESHRDLEGEGGKTVSSNRYHSVVESIPELPPYIYTIIAENPYPSMDAPP